MFRVDPIVYPFLSLLFLTIPLNWLIAALIAGMIHELCHAVMIYLFDGKIRFMRIGIGGAEIRADLDRNVQSFLSILAGPVGSLLLFFLYRRFPRLAICGAIQGIFNLLPLYPLDGGHLLRITAEKLCPKYARQIQKGMEGLLLIVLVGISAGLCLFRDVGILPVLFSLALTIKVFLRKKPCKQGINKIQ